jgi:hypothetical protein
MADNTDGSLFPYLLPLDGHAVAIYTGRVIAVLVDGLALPLTDAESQQLASWIASTSDKALAIDWIRRAIASRDAIDRP